MKKFVKRGLTLLLVLAVCISLLPALTFTADAATVNYVKDGKYVYNWGTREETATFLSPMAIDFYEANDVTYEELAALSGSSNTSSVPSSALYKRLQTLMKSNHGYETSYNATRDLFKYTDCQNSGGKISSFYSGTLIGPDWDGGSTWNREHTWPNSKGDASGNGENDIIMLRPTSTKENSSRGNKAYGRTTSSDYYNPNGESGGKYDLRGDVARILLFVYCRWGNTNSMWGASGVIESREVLLEWVEDDPVDTWELGRNDSAEAITGTRNVFVDYPELIFIMFGEEIPEGMDTPSGNAKTCAHEDSFAIAAKNPTCTAAGNTAGRYCNDCDKYYDGYTVLPSAGHRYTSVVTPPTATDQGYTTYTCSICGDTYKGNYTGALGATYTVSFDVPVGVDAVADMSCNNNGITLPSAEEPTDTYTFIGWTTAPVTDATTAPTIYKAGTKYTAATNTTLYALYTYGVGGTGVSEYVLTDLSDIKDTDTVVITVSHGDTIYAMYNANGASSAPTAVTVTAANNKLTQTPASTLLWNIVKVSGGYTIYPAGTTDKWLYSINDNNGIRVGTNTSKVFTWESGYFRHTGTNRYMGVYRGKPDWRGYTSINSNIADETYGFYVKTEAGVLHYSTLSCNHTETYVNNGDTHNVVCGTCKKTLEANADHTYVNGACPCGAQEIVKHEITLMSMNLENSLEAKFAFPQAWISGDGYKAIITQEGKESKTILQAEWKSQTIKNVDHWMVTYSGIAAKEMVDEITVVIYDAEGNVVADCCRSVKDYAINAFATTTKPYGKQLYADLLAYGAAAQLGVKVPYKTDDLATDNLPAEMLEYIHTHEIDLSNSIDVGGDAEAARAQLENNIILDIGFNSQYATGHTAHYSFTDHTGKVQTSEAEIVLSGGKAVVSVDKLVVADCGITVTVTIKDASGNAVATATDSVGNWATRAQSDLAMAIMQFSTSAYNYLH